MSIASEFEIREAVDVDDDVAVAALMVEYLTWAHLRLHDEYAIEEPPADVALVRKKLGEYRRPRGLLLLAECNGEPAGVGALRWLAEGVAEVKRMYVPARWRGAHLGSALLDRLLDEVIERSSTIVLLDTVRFMSGRVIPTRPAH